MKKLAAAAAITACLLVGVVAATAGARTTSVRGALDAPPIHYGVADDGGKYSDDPAAWFAQLKGGGLTQDRWTVTMDQTKPTTINELPFLLKAAPAAQAAGVRVIIALLAPTVKDSAGNVVDPSNLAGAQQDAFCSWAALVVNAVKVFGIHDFIIGNEVNTATFWAPQDSSAAPNYESTLAKCYDAIHGADSQANVIGFGLSPRTNGNASQQSPIDFLSQAAAAYKQSQRATPIMDQLAIHPYPNPNSQSDSPDVGYSDPKAYGIPNLDRVKQAVYDGFNGTQQPTTVNGLKFLVDELGWQTTETSGSNGYTGSETPGIQTIDEATQANFIQESVQKYFACDPTVTDVEFFLLMDEKNLGPANGSSGYQSGFMRPDGTPKPAYTQDAPFFEQGRAACTGAQVNWTPAGSTPAGGTGGTGDQSQQAQLQALQTFLTQSTTFSSISPALITIFRLNLNISFPTSYVTSTAFLNEMARLLGISQSNGTGLVTFLKVNSVTTQGRRLASASVSAAKGPSAKVTLTKGKAIKFPKLKGRLAAGTYKLQVSVSAGGKAGSLVTKPFTVSAKGAISFSTKPAKATKPAKGKAKGGKGKK